MRATLAGGVDLSLTGLGLAAAWSDWDLSWDRVSGQSFRSRSDAHMCERNAALAEKVVRWFGAFVTPGVEMRIWFEGYPTGGRVFNLDKLCELGGVVKHEIRKQLGIVCETAPQSTARKLLLGKLPPKDRKAFVVEALKAAHDPFDDDDQRDAFTAANYGLHEIGAPCLTNLLWTPEEKPKRRRKAA